MNQPRSLQPRADKDSLDATGKLCVALLHADRDYADDENARSTKREQEKENKKKAEEQEEEEEEERKNCRRPRKTV